MSALRVDGTHVRDGWRTGLSPDILPVRTSETMHVHSSKTAGISKNDPNYFPGNSDMGVRNRGRCKNLQTDDLNARGARKYHGP